MKNTCVFIASLFLFACGTSTTTPEVVSEKRSREAMLATVDSLESILRTKQQIDYQLGANMVMAYVNFVNAYPKDEKEVDMLFKAGDVSMNLRQGQKAIEFFKKVHDEHLASEKTQMALFLQGFIYETQLNDLAKARVIYQQVIAEYPDTKLASDAQASIDNLGKSDDQIIKEFEEKNKKK